MANSNTLAETTKLEFPAASPFCTLHQRVGLTDIEISYSRPSTKGREIFGGMVPFDKVWRTGANGATKLVFNTAVKLNGTEIPAGTYALMTIPGKDQWTIIINRGAEQWGSYKYDETADVAKFQVAPVKLDRAVETFTIEFDQLTDVTATLKLLWDKVEIPIKLEVDYIDQLASRVESVMASDEPAKPYFQAAQFYLNHNKDLKKALTWIDAAIAERDAFFIVHVKAKILAKLGDKAGAIAAAKHSKELAEKINELSYQKMNTDLINSLS
ncbi:MAG: DUF2911 domain-containing protein [Candidatus Obscuribacterales bacterium]|nr:DUF2911 domain-containing protein [Candidatus Obscuribacterales bacterium]